MYLHRLVYPPEVQAVPRRVLMTTDVTRGVWSYTLDFARTLCAQEMEIALATMGPLTKAQWREAERIPNLGVFEGNYQIDWARESAQEVAESGQWLLELEQRMRPDVIHLNHGAHGALPWKAPTLLFVHTCMPARWEAIAQQPRPAEWEAHRARISAGLRSANLVVAPSRAILHDLERFYGALPRAEVIPVGRDISFRRVPKEDFIFSSGRLWDAAKNFETLAAAAPNVAWPICAAGETYEPGGRTIALEHVRLLGELTPHAMAERYERASIFCLPARYEPFGMSVLEAALASCALVLGDIPVLRECWRECAVYVPPDDPEALAAALNRLIAEPEARKELAERASNRALEFTILRSASAYLALYSELMTRNPALVPIA